MRRVLAVTGEKNGRFDTVIDGRAWRVYNGGQKEEVMRYLLCIIPPLAVISCGKYVQVWLSLLLTICFWIPGIIHAVMVVNSHNADQRTKKITKSIEDAAQIQAAATAVAAAQAAQQKKECPE